MYWTEFQAIYQFKIGEKKFWKLCLRVGIGWAGTGTQFQHVKPDLSKWKCQPVIGIWQKNITT
jgi:hypothetical protein